MKAKLIVHTGSMFSGKTEGLIRDIKRYKIAKKNVLSFKPLSDDRYDKDYICSHGGEKIEAIVIENITDIFDYVTEDTDVVAIEEIQFFALSDSLQSETQRTIDILLKRNITVTVAGLDMTYDTIPFNIVPLLMAQAETVNKYQAVCVDCGEDAWVSWRIDQSDKSTVRVGEKSDYDAVCRSCYNKRKNISNNHLTI